MRAYTTLWFHAPEQTTPQRGRCQGERQRIIVSSGGPNVPRASRPTASDAELAELLVLVG